jgi:hypothetical protein
MILSKQTNEPKGPNLEPKKGVVRNEQISGSDAVIWADIMSKHYL